MGLLLLQFADGLQLPEIWARTSLAVVRSPWLWLIFSNSTVRFLSSRKVDGYAVSCGAFHRTPYRFVTLYSGSVTKVTFGGNVACFERNSLAC